MKKNSRIKSIVHPAGGVLLLAVAVLGNIAHAAFVPFTSESAWQAASGSTVKETFESFSVGDQVMELGNLGVQFDQLSGGGFPQIYLHGTNTTPDGRQHLGNFPNGINAINRFNNILVRPLSGVTLTGLGFWNGDGQADTFVASAFDTSGTLLGSVGAFKGNFAGFTSTTPIAFVRFGGNTGDGWNHLDGLQTSVVGSSQIPEPETIVVLLTGLLGLLTCRRSSSKSKRLQSSNRKLSYKKIHDNGLCAIS